MKPIKTLSIIALISIMLSGCNSKKQAMQEENNRDEQMIAQGYFKGTIQFSDQEGDCPYKIIVSNGDNSLIFYDPTNLGEAFKKDKAIVYFKFRGLRMMNRCDRASPIEVTEMELAD